MKLIVIILLCVIAITTSGCVYSEDEESAKNFCQKNGWDGMQYFPTVNPKCYSGGSSAEFYCIKQNNEKTEVIEKKQVCYKNGLWFFEK